MGCGYKSRVLAPITSEGRRRRREFSGWEWQEARNKESSGVNKCWGNNCLVTFTDNNSFLPSPPLPITNTVYTVRVLSARRFWMESSPRPGWLLVSSTWVFLGLEKNRYAVWCRLPGQGRVTRRNLPTKCYNSFTMISQGRH